MVVKDLAAVIALVSFVVSSAVAFIALVRYRSLQDNMATVIKFNEELRAQSKHDKEHYESEVKDLRAEAVESDKRCSERLATIEGQMSMLTAEFADTIVAKIIGRLP